MTRKSGTYFCDKAMLKLLNWSMFLSIRQFRLIGTCYKFRRFLAQIEANVPDNLDIHLVMDDYAAHKTGVIRTWLLKRPRWHVRFTPTGASWIDQVERFFATIAGDLIRRSSYASTRRLERDINAFIAGHNENPKPFVRIKSADDILQSIQRFCQKTVHIAQTSESGQ